MHAILTILETTEARMKVPAYQFALCLQQGNEVVRLNALFYTKPVGRTYRLLNCLGSILIILITFVFDFLVDIL